MMVLYGWGGSPFIAQCSNAEPERFASEFKAVEASSWAQLCCLNKHGDRIVLGMDPGPVEAGELLGSDDLSLTLSVDGQLVATRTRDILHSGPYERAAINGRGQLLAVPAKGSVGVMHLFASSDDLRYDPQELRLPPHLQKAKHSVSQIAAGGAHFVILLKSGIVLAAGDNRFSQLGGGGGPTTRRTEHTVVVALPFFEGLAPVSKVACGETASIAVLEDGSAFNWGLDGGRGSREPEMLPFLLLDEGAEEEEVVDVACMPHQMLCVTKAGEVWMTDAEGDWSRYAFFGAARGRKATKVHASRQCVVVSCDEEEAT